jgi:hypothetical protein
VTGLAEVGVRYGLKLLRLRPHLSRKPLSLVTTVICTGLAGKEESRIRAPFPLMEEIGEVSPASR